jgi:hypothetical protein
VPLSVQDRLEGAAAAGALDALHDAARLYVNFFQPSFKLKSKTRDGAKVTKQYHTPATPYERLLSSDRVTAECKAQLQRKFEALDPVDLLSRIRGAQRDLRQHEVGANAEQTACKPQDLTRFVESLSTAWKSGEVRATHRRAQAGPRPWRTRVDPFREVWPLIEQWLNDQPEVAAKDLFRRLQAQAPGAFAPGQLRTLQPRVRDWRTAIARSLIMGADEERGEAVLAGVSERTAE